MAIKHFLGYLFLLLVLLACVKPYYPTIDKYERVIVIDGTLTDDGTPPLVNISYSSNVKGAKIEKVAGAVVSIVTSDGQNYNLSEISKGTYSYTKAMFPVTIGSSYQLEVENEGQVFKSTMEKLIPSSPITDLSFQVKSDNSGIDLLISTKDVDSASKYYLWKLTETWKFRSPIYSSTRSVNKQICYASSRDELKLGTTELFSQNYFNRFPFLYIPASSPKLFLRYNILVEQLSISRSSYMYLNYINKTNESGGSLFDPIPANMNGNITSESAPVIGNFQVSSLKLKRIYIDNSDLPKNLIISSGMKDCQLNEISMSQKKTRDSLSAFMTVMDTVSEHGDSFVRFTTWERCFDCTATGSPNTPPTWWEEKK
jgi:hypothetical protein